MISFPHGRKARPLHAIALLERMNAPSRQRNGRPLFAAAMEKRKNGRPLFAAAMAKRRNGRPHLARRGRVFMQPKDRGDRPEGHDLPERPVDPEAERLGGPVKRAAHGWTRSCSSI
jgi:hypothetical protein